MKGSIKILSSKQCKNFKHKPKNIIVNRVAAGVIMDATKLPYKGDLSCGKRVINHLRSGSLGC